jgi:hypothetical protein
MDRSEGVRNIEEERKSFRKMCSLFGYVPTPLDEIIVLRLPVSGGKMQVPFIYSVREKDLGDL